MFMELSLLGSILSDKVPGNRYGAGVVVCSAQFCRNYASGGQLLPPLDAPPEPPECSHLHSKTRELGQDIKGNRLSWQAFCDQIDPIMRAVPEKMGCAIEVPHGMGIEAHQT
jgi:hypothetical protein